MDNRAHWRTLAHLAAQVAQCFLQLFLRQALPLNFFTELPNGALEGAEGSYHDL